MKLLVTAILALVLAGTVVSSDLAFGPDHSFLWNQFNAFQVIDSFALVTSDFGLASLKLDAFSGTFDPKNHLLLGNQALDVNISGALATVTTSSGLAYFVDLSQLPELTLIGQADLGTTVFDMVLVSSDLYLACGFDGLRHYRLEGGNDLVFVDSSLAPVHCTQVEVEGADLIVLDDYNGVLRFRPSPTSIGPVQDEILVPRRAMSFSLMGDMVILPLVGKDLVYRGTFDGGGMLVDSTRLTVVPDQVFAIDTFLVAIDLGGRVMEVASTQSDSRVLVVLPFSLELTLTGDTYSVEGAPHLALVSRKNSLLSYNLRNITDGNQPRSVYAHPGQIRALGFHRDRLATGGDLNPLETYAIDGEMSPVFDAALLSLTGATSVIDAGSFLIAHFGSISQVQTLSVSNNSITRIAYLAAATPPGGMKYYPYPNSDTAAMLLMIDHTGIDILGVNSRGLIRRAGFARAVDNILSAVVIDTTLLIATDQKQILYFHIFPSFRVLYKGSVSSVGLLTHMVNTGMQRNPTGGLEPGIILGFDGNQMYEVYLGSMGVPRVSLLGTLPIAVTSSAIGPFTLYTIGPMGVCVFDLGNFFPRLLRYGGYGGSLVAYGDSVLATSDGTAIHLYSNRDGTITFTPVEEPTSIAAPTGYLLPNYPNPFNPRTTIDFDVPRFGRVEIDVFDILGRQVATLFEGPASLGVHSVTWDGTDSEGRRVASGVYFYRMTMDDFSESRKMILLK
ncbi:MAG: T9SS type A sorting domain-containing protein [Candidatus Zixiibacteriota bacterium]